MVFSRKKMEFLGGRRSRRGFRGEFFVEIEGCEESGVYLYFRLVVYFGEVGRGKYKWY